MMMKKLNILLLILLPFGLFSQAADSLKTKNDSLKAKKWELGISFSPDYCYRTLKSDADTKWIKDSRDTMETGKFGYTAGINLLFKLNKKLKIETGILFSDSGEKTKKYAVDDVPSGQVAVQYSFNYHYYYLDIPVKADYFILTGKLKLYVTAGVSADFFLNQTTTEISTFAHSTTRKNAKTDLGFSKFNLAVLAGCGINYPLNDKTSIKVEPIYRRSLTSIINAPVKSYLYSAGLNIGIAHSF